jgi:hypothetical protein
MSSEMSSTKSQEFPPALRYLLINYLDSLAGRVTFK